MSFWSIELTWLPNPMPTPRRTRPRINIVRFLAAALRMAPAKKLMEPQMILARLPLFFVKVEAPKVEIRAAKYREEVKSVNIWSSYLQ